jgi:capsular polysaccharide biosynthesis protein
MRLRCGVALFRFLEALMNAANHEEHYINLGELADALLRRLGVLILTAVLCAAIGFGYSAFFVRPLYSASAMMIVNAGEKYPDYVSTDQLNSAATLVDTYSIIIKSDTVMNQVMDVVHEVLVDIAGSADHPPLASEDVDRHHREN